MKLQLTATILRNLAPVHAGASILATYRLAGLLAGALGTLPAAV